MHPVGHDRVNVDVVVDKDDDEEIALGETVAVALGEIVAVELDEAVVDTETECDGNEALAVGVVVVVVLDEAVGIVDVDIVTVTLGVDDTISCVKLGDGDVDDVALDVGDSDVDDVALDVGDNLADIEPFELDVGVRVIVAEREPVALAVIDGVAVADCITLDDVEEEPLTDEDDVSVGDEDACALRVADGEGRTAEARRIKKSPSAPPFPAYAMYFGWDEFADDPIPPEHSAFLRLKIHDDPPAPPSSESPMLATPPQYPPPPPPHPDSV